MSTEKIRVKIPFANGAREMEAERLDDNFAIHPRVFATPTRIEEEAGWTLTHVATGLRFPILETRAEAVSLWRWVRGLDWSFGSLEKGDENSEMARGAWESWAREHGVPEKGLG